MAKAGYDIIEFRVLVEDPELTEIYFYLQAWGDSPIGVQGWHHKTFPASRPSLDVLGEVLQNSEYVLWPLEAPKQAWERGLAEEDLLERREAHGNH